MKTSSLIISLLCLTVAIAQDNKAKDNPPDGNHDLAEKSRKAVVVVVNRKSVSVGKMVHFVKLGLFMVLFHFLNISLTNLLQISYSSFSLVSVPLVGNVILTNYLQVNKFVGLFDRVSDGSPLVHYVLSGLFLVLFHFLMINTANLLQISFPTLELVIEPLVGNIILTNNYR